MTAPPPPLRVGTRGSALALWQTERVRGLLAEAGYATERVEIQTTGDLVQNVPLSRIGDRALFTKQIDDALLERRIDLAVHSLKDLATHLPAGIALAAVGQREDPSDALVSRGGMRWADLPPNAVIATSSVRRRAQLRHARPDVQVVDVRGNVDTRLAKLDAQQEWHGVLLAAAGLERLGLAERISERLAPEVVLPAPGQGALAITARVDDDTASAAAHHALHHPLTALATAAERGFLRRLEGGCQVPVAALAHVTPDGRIVLRGRVVSLDGRRMVEGRVADVCAADAERSGEPAAAMLGARLAEQLLGEGAAGILAEARAAGAPVIAEP